MLGGAVDAAKHALGIASPSKVFAGIGAGVAQGHPAAITVESGETFTTDGRVRVVVAHRDPGVQNWLDTGGLGDAVMVTASSVNADGNPMVSVHS